MIIVIVQNNKQLIALVARRTTPEKGMVFYNKQPVRRQKLQTCIFQCACLVTYTMHKMAEERPQHLNLILLVCSLHPTSYLIIFMLFLAGGQGGRVTTL
jgi:hypothetical protein